MPPTKHLAVKQRLLATTAKMLTTTAPSHLSVEELCRVAKVSKPTFYRYFQGKEALMTEWLLSQANLEMYRHMSEIAAHGPSPTGRIFGIVRCATLQIENPNYIGCETHRGLFVSPDLLELRAAAHKRKQWVLKAIRRELVGHVGDR